MTEFKNMNKSQRGNAVVIVLVVLAVVAVGALAYLSGNIATDDKMADTAVVAAAETDTDAAEDVAVEDAAASEDAAADATTETDEETQTADATPAEDAAEPAEPAMKIEQGNPVVAKVGGEDVTRLDVLNFVQTLPPNLRQLPLEQLFPLAQDQVVNAKVIESNVKADEVVDNEQVQRQLEETRKQILQRAYLEKIVSEKMTDKRLQKAYKKAVTDEPDVEEVKAAHILVKEEAKAKEIIAKLNEGGDFAELAKENSTDGTAENGGSLGYFAKADVVPEFADAAFSQKEGTYTKEPVKSQFGFHIIKVEEKRVRPKPSFEDSKPYLEQQLSRELLEETVEGWKKDAKIEVYDINGNPVEEKSN